MKPSVHIYHQGKIETETLLKSEYPYTNYSERECEKTRAAGSDNWGQRQELSALLSGQITLRSMYSTLCDCRREVLRI